MASSHRAVVHALAAGALIGALLVVVGLALGYVLAWVLDLVHVLGPASGWFVFAGVCAGLGATWFATREPRP